MEQTSIWEKNLSTHRPRVDRFVTSRESLPELQRRLLWSVNNGQDVAWSKKQEQQKRYSKYLDDALGWEQKISGDEHIHRAWPCAPRKKTYLSTADSILDLPTYSQAIFPELLDWSNDNYLVAALGRSYHKWSWRTQRLISQGFANSDIHVCKFDPRGELLGLGTVTNKVEIHNSMLSKCVATRVCECQMVEKDFCSITALDWSPTGRSFVTGCYRGAVVAYDRNLKPISRLMVRKPLFVVRISPDTRYVAVIAVNDIDVLILTWPDLKRYTSLKYNMTVKALAWHPWRSALLGIGAITSRLEGHVAVWDIPTDRLVHKDLERANYILDSMLFSRRTGELVVSLSTINSLLIPPKTYSDLIVMNGRFSVVDHWGEGRTDLDRVRTMIFSPDGTKLATATAGEDLIIWNFLPEDRKRKKEPHTRRLSAIPVYLDIAVNGTSIR